MSYSEILIPTNGTKSMTKVVDCALEIAEQYGARVHVLHVVDTEWEELLRDDAVREQLFNRGETATDEIAERAKYHDLEVVTEVRKGVPQEVILRYADEHDIDMIVMGVDKPTEIGKLVADTILKGMLGGVTDHIVRHADVPVVTVRV